ncbi:hypothetical protein BofuT4_uP134050.1 [Botrytis cinerea T4]|uniref:Uncharacterized protein n=1 Tax=Botryotinia fuckeliana (strain T4) TaxID=999810 RepID=G2YQF3_BOTF4|nr:hypothetical protein BofuT4_uP134050.1 [Botrytis cinerea T4]
MFSGKQYSWSTKSRFFDPALLSNLYLPLPIHSLTLLVPLSAVIRSTRSAIRIH